MCWLLLFILIGVSLYKKYNIVRKEFYVYNENVSRILFLKVLCYKVNKFFDVYVYKYNWNLRKFLW